MDEHFGKWIDFLDPNKLKENLISISFFVASYESFKDYITEKVKFFFCSGFDEDGYIFSKNYEIEVLNKDKNKLNASLLWLKEIGAINKSDYEKFHEVRKYRNKITHEMMNVLFEGLNENFSDYLSKLLDLRIKIEKWWILNIEIPTNPDFDATNKISEDDIVTSSQILNQIMLDIISGDEKTANFYKEEFLKYKEQHK